MIEIQLYLAPGVPILVILTSLVIGVLHVSGIREDVRELRRDMNSMRQEIHVDFNNLSAKIELLTGKVWELMGGEGSATGNNGRRVQPRPGAGAARRDRRRNRTSWPCRSHPRPRECSTVEAIPCPARQPPANDGGKLRAAGLLQPGFAPARQHNAYSGERSADYGDSNS